MADLVIHASSIMNLKSHNPHNDLQYWLNCIHWEIYFENGSGIIKGPDIESKSSISFEFNTNAIVPAARPDDTFYSMLGLFQLNLPLWDTEQDLHYAIEQIIVDLTDVKYVNPTGILRTILLCQILHKKFGKKLILLLPENDPSQQFYIWIQYTDFLNMLDGIINIKGERQVPRIKQKDQGTVFVYEIYSERDVVKTLGFLEKLYNTSHGICHKDFDIYTILSEFCQNIYQHSNPGNNPYGYVAGQFNGFSLEFDVMDLGIGIPASLKSKFQFRDDDEAIRLAFKPGVSSKNSAGIGLPRTLEIVKQANGHMNVCSGNARAIINTDWDYIVHNIRYYHKDHDYGSSPFQGTQVGIIISRISNRVLW